jgi:asparagine synthase (glutamine-hydrolysing)
MHLNGHRDIRTVTVGFEGYWDNELETGRTVANHFKTDHHEVLLSAETFWDTLDPVLYAADEPLADFTTIPLYHLSEHARREVVVVLSGEGADELLAGYAGIEGLQASFQMKQRLRPLAPVARALSPLPVPDRLTRKLKSLSESPAMYMARTHATMTPVFPPDWRDRFAQHALRESRVLAALESYYHERSTWDPVHLYLGCLLEWWLPDDLLHKADRMTMAHSLELRCPSLDFKFARHCIGLGLDSKVTAHAPEPNRKTALKKAFMGCLPDGLATRKKRGFSHPTYEWVRTLFKDRIKAELERDSGLGSQALSRKDRWDIFERAVAGDLHSQRRVWSLVLLNKWADRWL